MKPQRISTDLFCFKDTCNVYVVREGGEAVAVDFGSGRWLRELPRLGIRRLRHVFLTHHHADQCSGLLRRKSWPFTIHAPAGEERFLTPAGVRAYWKARGVGGPVPPSYSVLPRGIRGVRFDMHGFGDLLWGTRRIRFVFTPGHGPHALSIVMTHHGRQVVFCGDAAHAGATIWQPFHLEWDHWTGGGALAAWEGVERLGNLAMDLLGPSHGPVIRRNPRAMLRKLAAKLLDFYRVKGSICPGERDRYLAPIFMKSGSRRVLPHLFQFGCNSYLLLSASGEALLVDPWSADLDLVAPLLKELEHPRITAATATHYHADHSDGLPLAKRRFGAKAWLHPRVAEVLRKSEPMRRPWTPARPIHADALWPVRGRWRWNEYDFEVAPFPGQTWWHAAFMTRVDGERVLFGGDNFQPPSRWNGTGGFSAFNGSRFEGFAESARQVLSWRPDLIVAGHGTQYRFHASHFRRIIAWAERAKRATRALCPSGKLASDYALHR